MAGANEGLRAALAALVPGAEVVAVRPLAPDAGVAAAGGAGKALGYGRPLLVELALPGGGRRKLVFRTQASNEFGHDRRADRAEGALLAWDLFNEVPDHVRALDVGAILDDGRLLSLRRAGELYLVTEWAEGTLYAEDLRRVAEEGVAGPLDLARAEALARWLVALHARKLDDPVAWRRAVRDLLGHGEGILGVADAYPGGVPGAPPARLRALEARCLAARWALAPRAARLSRTHGDFHPFNLVFRPPGPGEDGTRFTALDASRGGKGDPADDVIALSVNYAFFALERPAAWARGLGALWRRFWGTYLGGAADAGLLEAAPPFLAWRALVLSCPRFYPDLGAAARDALLGLAERALDAGRLDLDAVEALFAGGPGRAAAPGPSAAREGGAVVWVTGLPAAGKSTLARRLAARLAALGRPALLLDGDRVRAALVPAPGYDEAGRAAFYATLGNLALEAAAQGLVAVVPATAHRRAFRDAVRARAPRFVEILVDVPPEACAARDPKGLWARARAGGAPGLPGAGAEYERPLAPEVVAAGGEDPAAVEAAVEALYSSSPTAPTTPKVEPPTE